MNRPMQLSAEVRVAAEIIAQIRDAIGDDDADFIEIVENETDLLERLRRMLRVARLAEADAKATGEIMTELRERKARLEGRSEKLRGMVKYALCELGMTKLDAPDMTVSLRAGLPGVEITDLSQLPERYVKVTIAPDKAALREALKDGEQIPGACLKNAEPSLSIRSK
jgi:molybdopterin converting factor small subunit